MNMKGNMKGNKKLPGNAVSVYCFRMVGEKYDMMSANQIKDLFAILQSLTGQIQVHSDRLVEEITYYMFPPTFTKDERLIADFHKMKNKIMDFALANKWPSFDFELYILNPNRAVEAAQWQSLHGRWDVLASEIAEEEEINSDELERSKGLFIDGHNA